VDALMRRAQCAKTSPARSSVGETKNMSEEQLHVERIQGPAGNNVEVNVCPTCVLKYSLVGKSYVDKKFLCGFPFMHCSGHKCIRSYFSW
jgi:hypothetical protein